MPVMIHATRYFPLSMSTLLTEYNNSNLATKVVSVFEQPKYTQAGLSVIFPRKPEIRRLARELEDALLGQYNPPTVLGVPDELQAEVPRLIFQSTHGFSQLT